MAGEMSRSWNDAYVPAADAAEDASGGTGAGSTGAGSSGMLPLIRLPDSDDMTAVAKGEGSPLAEPISEAVPNGLAPSSPIIFNQVFFQNLNSAAASEEGTVSAERENIVQGAAPALSRMQAKAAVRGERRKKYSGASGARKRTRQKGGQAASNRDCKRTVSPFFCRRVRGGAAGGRQVGSWHWYNT